MSDLLSAWHQIDRAVSQRVFSALVKLGYPEAGKLAHPLTRGRWLVDTPTPLLASLLLYTIIVSVGCVVLNARKRRQPSKSSKPDPTWLRYAVQLHNIFLVVLSLWMSTKALYCAYKYNYKFYGQAVSTKEADLGYVMYIFYVSKIYEFMDTFIMLMRGKVEQVTFLHVYHHAATSSIWWAINYGAPGGDGWYCVFINALVHVIMYTYYLSASIIGKDVQKKRKYLWWGRYLTQFQMLQFISMMVQAIGVWATSPYPKFIAQLEFGFMVSLLILFWQFYSNKHHRDQRMDVQKRA